MGKVSSDFYYKSENLSLIAKTPLNITSHPRKTGLAQVCRTILGTLSRQYDDEILCIHLMQA